MYEALDFSMSKRKKQFLKGGLILSIAAFFMRTVSVSFNAYTVSKVGAEGMGLFTLTMSLYGFFLTLATSGVGLAVTRLVADAMGREDGRYAYKMLRRSFFYAVVCGLGASFVLYIGAPFMAEHLLRDERTLPSLRLLALGLTPIALSSVFSGYFVAVRRTSKNAAVQIAEQWIKIALTVFLLRVLAPKGVSFACVALVLGGMLGEVLSCGILAVTFFFDRAKHPIRDALGKRCKKAAMKPLLEIALPIAGGAYARSLLVTAEHMLIPVALAAYGASKEIALASYGALHSMAVPIALYPMALLTSFAGLLVPEYTEGEVTGNKERLSRMTRESFSATFAFALGCAAVLFLFGEKIGACLYGSTEAGGYIRALALLVPVMYLDHVTDAMLKGIGMQVYSMVVNIADAVLSIVLVLLFLPKMGAVGYVFVILIAEVFNFTLSYIGLYRRLGTGICLGDFRRPLLPLAGAFVCIQLFTKIPVKTGVDLGFRIALFSLAYLLGLSFTEQWRKHKARSFSKRGTSFGKAPLLFLKNQDFSKNSPSVSGVNLGGERAVLLDKNRKNIYNKHGGNESRGCR